MILVTGAAGYIGSQIVHDLYRLYDQPKVIGVDNLTNGYTYNLPNGFACFVGDAGHERFMSGLIDRYKVKQIIHCAASISVPGSVAAPMSYYDNNTRRSQTLIGLAIAHGVEGFVFSSSAAVYGQPEFARPLLEDDPTRPCSPYGWSKLMTEQMLRDAYVAHGMNTVILRYFNVAGADPLGQTGQTSPRATHLIKRACQSVIDMDKIEVFGDGLAVRDYVHVSDVAAANIGALEWTSRHNGCLTLNVGTGLGATVNEVLCRVAWHAKKALTISSAQPRDGDPSFVVGNTRLIREKFNWSPRYDLNDMVEHALAWEKTL